MTTAFISHSECLLHEMGPDHPECPERLGAIEDHLIALGLGVVLERYDAPIASDESLLRAHTAEYLNYLRAASPERGLVYLDGDTALNCFSIQAALRAAGAAVLAVDLVMAGQAENAFCSVRPPGHHALADQAMGFCLFNNVAIAAYHALEVHGLERVAIVDFDVHHGNGTESIVAGDPRIVMVGSFQHPFYPYSGTPAAAQNIFNVPLSAGSAGDMLRKAVESVWLPVLDEFAPQLVVISAGFDAHREDDMAGLLWVEKDYAWLTSRIVQVAQVHAGGRIVSCLEGGYALSALGRSVIAHLRVLADI